MSRRRVLTGLVIDKIAAVDRPCQEHATVTIMKRDFSQKERDKAAESGAAMKDGSYPIETVADLHDAIQAFGRAKNKSETKAHIKTRARALGASDQLPDGWMKKFSVEDFVDGLAKDVFVDDFDKREWDGVLEDYLTAFSFSTKAIKGELQGQECLLALRKSAAQFIDAVEKREPGSIEGIAAAIDVSDFMAKQALSGMAMLKASVLKAKANEMLEIQENVGGRKQPRSPMPPRASQPMFKTGWTDEARAAAARTRHDRMASKLGLHRTEEIP